MDIYSVEVLVPSLVIIGAMVGAMAWGYFKVMKLVDEDQPK
ncbi:hypothetical protein [Neptuniibacter sp. QD37_11]